MEQDMKCKQFAKGKESLFFQSKYVQFTDDLRRFHLKKGIEDSKNRFLTVDKLLDINDRYRAHDFHFSTSVKPQDVNKMVARVMSRAGMCGSVMSGSRTAKTGSKYMRSDDKFPSPVEPNLNPNDKSFGHD